MMKKIIFLILCGFFAQCVVAQENCTALKANKIADSSQERYVFKQHTFADGQTDLVIEQHLADEFANAPSNPLVEIRRVTFGRSKVANTEETKTCFFQPLAFAQGGQAEQYWGWHMLWMEGLSNPQAGGLFYARMDGEAWVSSVPKRLTKFSATNPQFSLHSQSLIVTWQQVENGVTANMQGISSDEGRSWIVAPIQ